MKINLELTTDNAAFEDNGIDYEVSKILKDLAYRISENGIETDNVFILRDTNGNKVGEAKVSF